MITNIIKQLRIKHKKGQSCLIFKLIFPHFQVWANDCIYRIETRVEFIVLKIQFFSYFLHAQKFGAGKERGHGNA